MQKSMTAAKEGKWEPALDEARKAVKKAPGNTLANVLLAITLEKNNRPEEALKAAKNASESDKSSFTAQYILGRHYCRQQKYLDAIEPLTRALELNPKDANTIILLAEAKIHLNNFEDAIRLYERLLDFPEFQDSSVLENEIGVLYVRKNDPNSAREHFSKAISCEKDPENPENPISYLNYAILWDKYLTEDPARKRITARAFYLKFLNCAANRPTLATLCEEVNARLEKLDQQK